MLNAYYLLGFCPEPGGDHQLNGLSILAQLGIEHCSRAGVVAWYRAIARSEFEGASGQRNLADLNWLTPRVLAHESVVSKLSEHYPFYPARFGCLFSSLELLMQYAAIHRTTLKAFFAAADGRQEWGVKFTVDLELAAQSAATQELAAQGSQGAGLNYLKLKQLQRAMRGSVLEQLHHTCDERIQTLRSLTEHVAIRPQRSLAQPDRETLLANIALWLIPSQTNELLALCNQWNQVSSGASLIAATTTGPWPAYSFCPSLNEAQIAKAA